MPRITFPATDKRLLGRWKSDRRRTFKDWSFKPDSTAGQKHRLKTLFGKLIVTYTRTRLHADLEGFKTVQHYQVVASDSDSVAIVHWDSTMKQPRIQHVHFERDYYWITLGAHREFFRKLNHDA